MKYINVSVIIVGYNSLDYLTAGLPSVIDSLGSEDELILVDNASQDDSANWVRQNHPEVRLILSETNLGFGGGNNLGAQTARGEFLVFLNPDTLVDPGWLEPLIRGLQADPQIGMTTSKILLLEDPQKINTCGNAVHLSGITLCRGMGSDSDEYTRTEEVPAVSGAACAIKKDLFIKLGGFDDEFFLYMEDTDLSLRVRLAGLRILFIPESVVRHAYRLRFGPRKVYYQERNRYMTLLKMLRWRTLLAMLPMLLFGELVTLGFVLLRERARFGNKIRACGWVLSHWREISQKRKRVQSSRKVSDRQLLSGVTPRLDFGQVESKGWIKFALLVLNLTSTLLTRLTLALIWQ